jgi:hypothetical protein
MINFSGVRGSYFLFSDGIMAVVVDSTTNMVDEVGQLSALSHIQPWETPTAPAPAIIQELASGALSDLSISAVTASGRMYTIPKAAQEEAKRGLEWRKEHNRGGTPVGVNSARILANGGQIGIKKVRHIAKYFPRHEVDKKGKGYKPGEDGFPSAGRIAWALWGGDAAWRWAQQIVERENKKGMRADGYGVAGNYDEFDDYEVQTNYISDLSAFKLAKELNDDNAPEFVARVRMDHGGIDRLYMVDLQGKVHVWDEAGWDDLGHVDSDISTYDKSLDDPYDKIEKVHIPIDPESALILSAYFQENPHGTIGVYDLYPDEAELVSLALNEIDWTISDMAVTAASDAPTGAADEGDGMYTPDERSANAQKQVRDRGGKFAKAGSRVAIGGDISRQGNITSIDRATQSVVVKMDSGESVRVPGVQTQAVEDVSPPVSTSAPREGMPLDTSGILGMPRTPMTMPNARIGGTLPALTSDQLQQVLYNYPAWVKSQRDAGLAETYTPPKPKTDEDVDKYAESYMREREKISGTKELKGDLRQHPLFKDIFKKNPIYNLYYNPRSFMASVEPKKTIKEVVEQLGTKDKGVGKPITPDTSDVQPMYMAIVSPDDPAAVFDLISLVPAGANSTQPAIFKRVDQKWVPDQKILSDLTSPTPPPVVPLQGDDFLDVLSQVDGTTTASAHYAITAAGIIVPEERDLADALIEITQKYGKFNSDDTGVWAGYESAAENEIKDIGVTCANCILYEGGSSCKIIAAEVEPGGYCRFALIPDGVVSISKKELTLAEPVYEVYPIAPKKKTKKYNSVEEAVEDFSADSDSALVAVGVEGGLDRNRGNAEKLRRYWTIGRGGLKIRWNTPGDWTRCYRQLMKYMGPRAKGYCSLRHKEMTGVWPGSKYNVGKKNKNIIGSGDAIRDEQEIFEMLFAQAGMQEAKDRVLMASIDAPSYGAKFRIPLVIPEETESGDGRKFKKGAITVRELPLPLLWQIKTADGHSGSVVVGRIDHMERVDGGIGNAHGVFDTSAYGKEAERMVRDGFIRGVSADLDKFEASEDAKDEAGDDTDEMKAKKIGGDKITITKSRVMAVTIVPKPAFEECKIYLEDTVQTEDMQEEPMENLPDGVYIEDGDGVASIEAAALLACGMIAGAIPTVPPAQWFANPELSGPTPLTVDDDGRVFGHVASWKTDHIGMRSGTRAPKSRTGYAYFHTGVVRADDGKDYTVGQLTLAGGHASLEASALEAARHYDDTGSAIADVHAGEDQFGIWVAGALRPSASPEQIRALRASAPSGDWRPINGSLELVAVCQVNVPGFPIARARVASGQIYALVAAGAASLAQIKEDPMQELAARIDRLEKRQAANPELAARAEELSNKIRSSFDYETFGYMSRQMREKLASEGKALPDGSYPIRNVEDLKNAIQAYGRSKPSKRAAVRRHIIKKARGLGKSELVPEKWKTAGLIDDEVVTDIQARVAAAKTSAESTKAENAQKVEELRARVASAKEGLLAALPMEPTEASEVKANPEAVSTRGNKYISGVNQPRDQKGKFREVLARLKQDLGDSGLQGVMDKIEEADSLVNAGNYEQAAAASADLINLISRLDSGALDATSLENVRIAAQLLGTVISNLPLPFNEQSQKVRFSDLPPVLKDLIDDMITKVEAKIGKEDANEATKSLRSYKSGSDVYSQGEVSSEMSKLLRLLT